MYDAVLIVSFGGPEETKDVLPFLENVTRGRNIPRDRLLEVAEHYYHFGGKSPINDHCRALMDELRNELDAHGLKLPIYWGNRNWTPFLPDALRQMRDDGVRNALALVTSAYSSYSGCRQYRENIAAAQAEVGEGAPKVDKLRVFYNHPGFIEASADRVREALRAFLPNELPWVRFFITAHSIPCSMAETSAYEKQLRETSRLVAEAVGLTNWELVYQSRSGSPSQPWLGPDILDALRKAHEDGVQNVIVAPLGFVSDHMEVLYDLDTEAQALAQELRMKLVRAATVGTHPAFVRMVRQLIAERALPNEPKLAVGLFGPNHDLCPVDCCPAPVRGGRPPGLVDPSVLQRA
jgi:ferrochelatase